MESKVNYTLVGLTVILLTAGLIAAGLWLSIGFDRKTYNRYIVYMHESIAGLSEESPVKYNGVKVGQVSKIELSKTDPQKTRIIIQVEAGTPITTTTYATLITQGITGTTYLGLSPATSTFLPLQRTPGERYPVIPSRPSFFHQLEKNLNEISEGFKRILTKENARNLNSALNELPKALNELRVATKKFTEMSADMSTAGRQVTSTMKVGKDTIDKISQQTIPPAVILLRRLDDIAANLEKVSEQMRQNPAVIIRGTTPPPPGPGE
ncbi:MlaD family protein [Legionella impletisoli]|uniref:ABC transporter substrate-binding protein n=1 Tax=Legionella impletisoli TaxID=343510 RepID=A0A917JRR0_9GAMM|nr:MlaD family protein [Legionella impletisoli]GGI82853.1 ABC transporter substrate-binding protein [Legionella impletisoli]